MKSTYMCGHIKDILFVDLLLFPFGTQVEYGRSDDSFLQWLHAPWTQVSKGSHVLDHFETDPLLSWRWCDRNLIVGELLYQEVMGRWLDKTHPVDNRIMIMTWVSLTQCSSMIRMKKIYNAAMQGLWQWRFGLNRYTIGEYLSHYFKGQWVFLWIILYPDLFSSFCSHKVVNVCWSFRWINHKDLFIPMILLYLLRQFLHLTVSPRFNIYVVA